MARARNKLTARAVMALSAPGKHSDGGGLYLRIDGDGAADISRRRWIFRFAHRGATKEMGLGGFPEVSLADARKARDAAETQARSGLNPVAERNAAGQAKAAKPTFGEAADALITAKQVEWRNDKHKAQWTMTLTTYAAPLRSRPVDEIDTAAVLAVLTPVWQTKPETASRLRGRIEAVLDAAKAQGHRSGENPAAWRGHLSHLLPKRGKLTRGHHAAMPYEEVPAFVKLLREREAIAAMAIEFVILTAARTGEVIGARWSEIDPRAKVWTVPAERMKAAREHRVPLSGPALAILDKLGQLRTGEYVFSGQRSGRPMSSMAMEMVLRRMKLTDVTVHGFRSSFRDWAGNETHFPRELAEAALAHVIGDKAEQAYRRGDALEKRRALMDAWAFFCDTRPATCIVTNSW